MSRVSASVTRSPLINSLFLPSASSVRVSWMPPPCTTATWLPSRTSSAIARTQPCRSSGVFEARSAEFDHVPHCQALRFVPAEHHVHVLYRLARCALQQVVQAAHNHSAPAIARQLKPDIAKLVRTEY